MTLQIEYETEYKLDIDYEEAARFIVAYFLDYMKCPYEAEVNLTITDNASIRELNREYREIDRPTDVLSFPLVDYQEPGCFDGIEEHAEDYFNLDTGELMLGDIVISAEKVAEQAQEYGHSQLREYSFLIVHSLLHLYGYDHMEEEERLIMEAKQAEILDSAGIKR